MLLDRVQLLIIALNLQQFPDLIDTVPDADWTGYQENLTKAILGIAHTPEDDTVSTKFGTWSEECFGVTAAVHQAYSEFRSKGLITQDPTDRTVN